MNPEPQDDPVPIAPSYFQQQQPAPAEEPGLGSKVLGGLGWGLGLLARPVQTMAYGLATGEHVDPLAAMLNPEQAKDMTDLRRKKFGKSDVEDKQWLESPSVFAAKLGLGATDLLGNALTDPTTYANPLSFTKAGVAVRSIQEGAQAEIMQGGRNYLKQAAARNAQSELEYAAEISKHIEAGLVKDIQEKALAKGLTEEQVAQQIQKASERAFKYAEGAASHVEIAPTLNRRLATAEKELGLEAGTLGRAPEWTPPQSGTFDDVEKSFARYQTDLNKFTEELMPKRIGDQINKGLVNFIGIGDPLSDVHTMSTGLGMKRPGDFVNKIADVKDGIVQTMEATSAGRAVLDAKDWFSKSIMNPVSRGAIATLERMSLAAPNTMMQQLGTDSLKAYKLLEDAGFDAESRAMAGRYFTVSGVEGEGAKAIQAEMQPWLDKLSTKQKKALAEAESIRRDVMQKVLAAEKAAGIDKEELGQGVRDVVKTIKQTLEEKELQFTEAEKIAREAQAARNELNQLEGRVAAHENLQKQRDWSIYQNQRVVQQEINDGVQAQRTLEEGIRTRPAVKQADDELAALIAARDAAPAKAPITEFVGEGQVAPARTMIKADFDAQIVQKKAQIKALKEESDHAIQAVRATAQVAAGGPSEGAAAFYLRNGLSVEDALALGRNRAAGANPAQMAPHSAESFRALRKTLPQTDREKLIEGMATTDAPLPRNMWPEQHIVQPDAPSLQAASASEARMQQLFQEYLNGNKAVVPQQMHVPFEKMKNHLDNDRLIAGSGKKIEGLKAAPVGKAEKYGPKFPAPTGLADAHLMSKAEYIAAAEKEMKAGGNAVVREQLETQHKAFIKRQIDRGESVPRARLEEYADDPMFQKGTQLWHRNEENWRKGGGIMDMELTKYRNQLIKDIDDSEALLRKTTGNVSPDVLQVRLKSLKEELNKFDTATKDIPNYMMNAMSEDALRKVVGARQAGLIKLHYNEIERQFHQLGVPLSHGQINDMIAGGGKEGAVRTIAGVGGELPEATFKLSDKDMPYNRLLSLWKPSENDFKELAKVASKVEGKTVTVEMAKAMPVKDRIKYYQQTFGKFFDERPEVLDALRIDEAARAIQNKTYVDGIKRAFSEPIPFKPMTEEQTARRAEMMGRYRELQKSASSREERAALKQMREYIMAEFNRPDFKPGYVDAEIISPALKGRMVKRDVMDQALRHLDAMKDPTWMKGMMQHMATANTWWKAMQLGLPGPALRDWLGNLMMRFQRDGFHPQSVTDAPKLMKVMGSGGDAKALAGIEFSFPNGLKMSGQEMHDTLLKEGVWGQGQAREVVQQSMKGIAERSKLGNRLTDARNKVMSTMNLPQEFERMSMFHSRLAMGDTVTAAANAVDEALYNYARVSPFVDFTRKTGLIPFATWMSKNIPAQLELMVKHPGQFAGLLHAKRALEGQAGPGVTAAEVPEWTKNNLNVITQIDPETGDVYFKTLTGLIPAADLFVGSPTEVFGSMLGPLPKTTFESLFNIDLFTKKEMERWDGELTPLLRDDPDSWMVTKKSKNLITNLVGRPIAMANDIVSAAKDAPDKYGQQKSWADRSALWSAGTGLNPVRYSAQKQQEDRKRKMEDLERNISTARNALIKASGRPGGENAARAYQQQLYKLQEQRAELMSR